MSAQPAPRTFSTVFGLLMAAATAAPADGLALVAAALAAGGVLVGLVLRPVATAAVMAAAAALALAEPEPVFAALAGLSATAYLVIRYAVGTPEVVTTTRPTMLTAIGFTVVGLAASSWAVTVPWLPLLAPLAAGVVYVLALRPFVEEGRWSTAQYRQM
ncbi:hypothetical protein ACRCUN_20270 [Mycobacterium sp. LTG2003]